MGKGNQLLVDGQWCSLTCTINHQLLTEVRATNQAAFKLLEGQLKGNPVLNQDETD